MSNNQNSIVTVTGDRFTGLYKVILLNQYHGNDVTEDETVYKAKIIELIDNRYNYKINDMVFIFVSNARKDIFGCIDPFINKKNAMRYTCFY